jgi:hypothetical protein
MTFEDYATLYYRRQQLLLTAAVKTPKSCTHFSRFHKHLKCQNEIHDGKKKFF